jgi:hypothetical protein
LATPEDFIAEAISFASLTDAIAVAMEQWSAQRSEFIVEIFLKMATLLLKRGEYFASVSILLVVISKGHV